MLNTHSKVETRRRRDIERTRGDILEAAIRAFAKKGFAATTMQDIASEAQYSAASLYSYFESKDEISEGIVELVKSELFAQLDAPVGDGAFATSVADLVERLVVHIDARHEAFAVLQDGANHQARSKEETIWEQYHARLAKWMRVAATKKDLAGSSPEDAASALAGIMMGFFRNWATRSRPATVGQRVEAITRFFLHGLAGAAGNGRRR